MADHVAEGHYYSTQIGSKNKVIAWSHQSRFDKALDLIGSGTQKLLDYGCGDGTFLAMASDRFVEGHGVDVDELSDPKFDRTYDVVTCMETLEHCTAPVVEIVLADVARLVAPGGRVVISVPIEIGPSFLVKQSVRAIARRQGASSYQLQEKYPAGEALKMLFARQGTSVDRPVYGDPPMTGHSHYGFNWRALRGRVAHHLTVERTLFTPLGFLGGMVSSQAYFVCRPAG